MACCLLAYVLPQPAGYRRLAPDKDRCNPKGKVYNDPSGPRTTAHLPRRTLRLDHSSNPDTASTTLLVDIEDLVSIMATADVIRPSDFTRQEPVISSAALQQKPVQHNVRTVLNYYKDPEDGTPPAPFYVEYVSATPDTTDCRQRD